MGKFIKSLLILLAVLMVLPVLLGVACDTWGDGDNVKDGGEGVKVVDCEEQPQEGECQDAQAQPAE